MNEDRLRFDLADLADEVTPVDLRDRALRTSRRLGIQRTVTTSVAALVMIAAATGTALAIRPNGQANLPAPATSVTVTPTEVTPTPQPSPTTEPPATATTSAAAEPTATIGQIFYGPGWSAIRQETGSLWSFQPGDTPVRLLDLPPYEALANASVSPDGKRIAWVDRDAYLRVANVDGSKERKLSPGGYALVDGDCWTPIWSPDSQQLLLAVVVSAEPSLVTENALLDLASGKYRAIKMTKGCHPVWSADGRTLAYAEDGQIALTRADGTGKRFIPGLGVQARYTSSDLASLSPDGSRIALKRVPVGGDAGDVGRSLDVNAVLDTRTGKKIDLPLGGRTMLQAYFQADGSLVVRVDAGDHNALVLIDTDGRKVSETREPAALKNMQILQIAG